jgi:hypothetical protein
VATPGVLDDLPPLAGASCIVCSDSPSPLSPADRIRQALADAALEPFDALLVVANGEPLIENHEAGAVYRAVDFVNTVGDNPLIGSHFSNDKLFFMDMENPFSSDYFSRFNSVSGVSPRDAVIGFGEPKGANSAAERAWLHSLGIDFVSPLGVNEAVAARAMAKPCMALFYARGDREGARSLLTMLADWGILDHHTYETSS